MSREPLPDPTNTLKALHYVQGQASMGRFDGHSSALLVMYYLVMNMWARESPDGQGPGEVMIGKSSIGKIAAATALSRSSVQRAVKWLADNEWINTQRELADNGSEVSRYIFVRLNMEGHRERERLRASKPAPLRLVEGGRGGVTVTYPPVAL